jgi:hypothetical protein
MTKYELLMAKAALMREAEGRCRYNGNVESAKMWATKRHLLEFRAKNLTTEQANAQVKD